MNKRNRRSLWLTQFANYGEYLASAWWKSRRARFWANHKRICFCCEQKATEIHHCSYDRKGAELDKDLVPLCRQCHETITRLVAEYKLQLLTAHIDFKAIYALRISDKETYEYLKPIYRPKRRPKEKWERRLSNYSKIQQQEYDRLTVHAGRTVIKLGA